MTFPTAALIHKRRQQPRRRIIPALTLATATLVTAVLFLGISSSARAEELPKTTNDCAGLTAVAVTAANIGSTSRAISSGDCNFSIEVRHTSSSTPQSRASESSTEPCTVTATPSPLGDSGARVTVTYSGDCDGIEARWTVRPSDSAVNSSPTTIDGIGASSANSTNAEAYALLEGYDNKVAKILMFENKSRAYWVSTPTSILRATHYPSQRGYPTIIGGAYLGEGWSVTYAFPQLTTLSNSLYEASNSVNLTIHVPVLADPSAETRADL